MQINYEDQTCDFEVISKLSHDDEVSLKNKYTGYNAMCANVQYRSSAQLSFITILCLFIYNFVLLLH